ncbi:MAG TPA: LysE family transporter [Candidatus Limnocylindria bacterium]|nr:LysE family transporter [Candidatus Limnocylindria bacterium]
MIDALVLGALAGYAIAMPVGPIAVLILRTGMRDGARAAFAAGAGAATADLIYASTAMLAGPILVGAIAPVLVPVRLAAAAVLLALALRMLRAARDTTAGRTSAGVRRTYATVLFLTILNPATIVYFASLSIGLPALSRETAARAAFVVAAVLASLSWQWLLAAAGASLHGRVPPRLMTGTAIVSAVIIAGLALKIGSDALRT